MIWLCFSMSLLVGIRTPLLSPGTWKLGSLTQDMAHIVPLHLAHMVPWPLAHMVPQLLIRDNRVIFKFLKVVIFYFLFFFLLPRNGCFGPKLTFKSWIRWRECDAMHGKWKSQSIKKFMIIGFVFLRITRGGPMRSLAPRFCGANF